MIDSARKKYELFITTILFVAFVIILALRIILACSYLPETGGVSVNVMYGIQHLYTTGNLYLNPENAPFSIIQYTPLHYYMVDGLGKLAGASGDVHTLAQIHRFFCLFCDLLSIFLLFKGIRKLFPISGFRNALSASFIYFLLIPVINFARVDNLYLLFFTSVIIFLLHFLFLNKNEKQIKTADLIAAGTLSAFALLSKQSAIFLIAFVSLYLLLIIKDFRSLLIYAGSFTVIFVVILLLLVHEPFIDFKLNIVDGLKNGINFNWFFEVFIKNFFLKYAVFLAFGIYIGCRLLQSEKNTSAFFIGAGICFFMLSALSASLKGGSGPNYYLEFSLLTLLGICLLLNENPALSKNYFHFAAILIPFFLLSCINDKGWGYLSLRNKAKRDYANCVSVADYIKGKIKNDEYILSAFHKENCLNLLLSQYALFPCREVALYYTYPKGVFHFKQFKTLLNEKRVMYYIDEKGSAPGKFLEEDLSSFVADTTIGNYTLYKPIK